METSALLQTIAVLAACVVFLAKQGFDGYKRYGQWKNGNGTMPPSLPPLTRTAVCHNCRAHENASLIQDLHDWHRPVKDPATGQPRFLWYGDSQALREEHEKTREAMDELRDAMGTMTESISQLVEQVKGCAVRQGG